MATLGSGKSELEFQLVYWSEQKNRGQLGRGLLFLVR
jgi:hypothetical protein